MLRSHTSAGVNQEALKLKQLRDEQRKKQQEAINFVDDDRYRLVLLGGPQQERWLQFRAPLGTEVVPEFEAFSQSKLGPVYLMNLQADFGGNVHQVRPDEQPFFQTPNL